MSTTFCLSCKNLKNVYSLYRSSQLIELEEQEVLMGTETSQLVKKRVDPRVKVNGHITISDADGKGKVCIMCGRYEGECIGVVCDQKPTKK